MRLNQRYSDRALCGRLSRPALQKTGATISSVWNNERFQGGLTVFGGVGEVAGGIALATVGAPTVGLSVIGGALATHGADTFQTGLRKIWNNQHRATYAEDFMRSSGMNPTTAMFADTILSMASAGGLMKAGGVMPRMAIASESYEATSIFKTNPRQFAPPYLLDDSYQGVRDASKLLRDAGIKREKRLDIINSFQKGTIQVREATANDFGLRYYDNIKAFTRGHYLFETFPATRYGLAVDSSWNQFLYFKQWKIKEGTSYLYGRTSMQGPYLYGGMHQKVVLNPKLDLH